MTPERLKAIREDAGLTLRQMASYMGLSGENAADVVRGLEQGRREPTGPQLRLYQILEAGLIPDEFLTNF